MTWSDRSDSMDTSPRHDQLGPWLVTWHEHACLVDQCDAYLYRPLNMYASLRFTGETCVMANESCVMWHVCLRFEGGTVSHHPCPTCITRPNGSWLAGRDVDN